MALVLLRYGEIALKSNRTRRKFAQSLVENIERSFANRGLECLIREERGRIFLETGDYPEAERALRNVFGIVSFSPVIMTKADRGAISEAGISLLKDELDGERTFAVKCRRKGSHRFTSQEMAAEVGEDILERFSDLKVNLSAPDVTLEVEIREDKAYVFTRRVPGPGGFPLGTQGKVGGLVEKEDLARAGQAATAFFLMMKRGCRVVPYFLFDDGEDVEELLGMLRRFDPRIRGEFLPEAKNDCGELVPDALPQGSALVSARNLEDGLLRGVESPVFYPLAALPEDVLNSYEDRLKAV